jgi:actin
MKSKIIQPINEQEENESLKIRLKNILQENESLKTQNSVLSSLQQENESLKAQILQLESSVTRCKQEIEELNLTIQKLTYDSSHTSEIGTASSNSESIEMSTITFSIKESSTPIHSSSNYFRETNTLVLDIGSEFVKAGFSGFDHPQSVFQNLILKPKSGHFCQTYVENDKLLSTGKYILSFPVKNGIISNCNDLEEILNYVFKSKLKVDPTEQPILLTEPISNPKNNREKTLELMFETINTPFFYLASQPMLSLYGSGRTTGIIVESGGDITQIVPIYDGNVIKDSAQIIEFGGRNITSELISLITLKGNSNFNGNSGKRIIRDCKEKICYVSLDYNAEAQKAFQGSEIVQSYQLSDGNSLEMNEERFQASEIFFTKYSVHQLIYDTIMKSNPNYQQQFFENIVLGGGNTMFKGLVERLSREMNCIASKDQQINVIAPHEYSSWFGGSILASTSDFLQIAISKNEFREIGSSIIHQKC